MSYELRGHLSHHLQRAAHASKFSLREKKKWKTRFARQNNAPRDAWKIEAERKRQHNVMHYEMVYIEIVKRPLPQTNTRRVGVALRCRRQSLQCVLLVPETKTVVRTAIKQPKNKCSCECEILYIL